MVSTGLPHPPLMICATFSVPPVGLKMISTVRIDISSCFHYNLPRMPSMHWASVCSDSARVNALSACSNILVSTGLI